MSTLTNHTPKQKISPQGDCNGRIAISFDKEMLELITAQSNDSKISFAHQVRILVARGLRAAQQDSNS